MDYINFLPFTHAHTHTHTSLIVFLSVIWKCTTLESILLHEIKVNTQNTTKKR